MKKLIALLTAGLLTASVFSGCASGGESSAPADSGSSGAESAASQESQGGKEGGATITMAMVNCPVVQKLAELTPEYYKAEGVNIVIDVLEEENLRTKLTNMVATGDNTYDLYMLGAYELSTWIDNGWVANVTPFIESKSAEDLEAYDADDFFESMAAVPIGADGNQYAVPFFGESTFIMYNAKMFEDAGITPTATPSWDDIYSWAKTLTDKQNEQYGFVVRGNVGWGASGSVLKTIINSYGAKCYDADWNTGFKTDEMKKAWETYYNLAVDCGPNDVTNCTYNDCISYMTSGKGAMWYDATSNASNLDTEGSEMKDNIGYMIAPNSCGWIWEWAFALNPQSPNGQAVVDYMMWASSKDYVDLTMGLDPTGAATPSGVRASTYERDDYKGLSYASKTLEAIGSAKFEIEGSPVKGNQFLAIPEWSDLGDYMTQQLASYVIGDIDLDTALDNCDQYFADEAAEAGYKE